MARLIEPEDYRPDWAKEYKKWFNSDFNGWPELYLYPKQ